MFKVNVVARNTKMEEMAAKPMAALVDTGSELTWLPADVLKAAGGVMVDNIGHRFVATTTIVAPAAGPCTRL
jgi:hypothetical protein